MLIMVIEHFKDTKAIGERFRLRGRLLPDSITYLSSWIDPATQRCFQLMESPSPAHIEPWLQAWQDLATFEVIPVQTSKDFWSNLPS